MVALSSSRSSIALRRSNPSHQARAVVPGAARRLVSRRATRAVPVPRASAAASSSESGSIQWQSSSTNNCGVSAARWRTQLTSRDVSSSWRSSGSSEADRSLSDSEMLSAAASSGSRCTSASSTRSSSPVRTSTCRALSQDGSTPKKARQTSCQTE